MIRQLVLMFNAMLFIAIAGTDIALPGLIVGGMLVANVIAIFLDD